MIWTKIKISIMRQTRAGTAIVNLNLLTDVDMDRAVAVAVLTFLWRPLTDMSTEATMIVSETMLFVGKGQITNSPVSPRLWHVTLRFIRPASSF